MKDNNNSEKKFPFVVEFIKFASGFAVIIAAGLLVLKVAS
jgi:hypothetical protein